MIYPIVKFGDPVLERRGETVREFDTPELHKLLEDMFESMYASKGVGLAAPQIGNWCSYFCAWGSLCFWR